MITTHSGGARNLSGRFILADIVDNATRSRMMAGIKGKNTSPELYVRKALHARGFRFRIHTTHLPGKPDLVLPKYKAAIFVHGCFWHGHNCHYFKIPKTRTEFWLAKIEGNKKRDIQQIKSLNNNGWRVLIIWECAVRQAKAEKTDILTDHIAQWLLDNSEFEQIQQQSEPSKLQ